MKHLLLSNDWLLSLRRHFFHGTFKGRVLINFKSAYGYRCCITYGIVCVSADVNLWNKNMGQKWRKIRRRCSSFNAGGGGKSDDGGRCEFGHRDGGPLLPLDDSTGSASLSPTPAPPPSHRPPSTTMHDALRARLNAFTIGKRRRTAAADQRHHEHRQDAAATVESSCTFYVPSPLLRTAAGTTTATTTAGTTTDHRYDDDDDDDDPTDGPCSLPVAFDHPSDRLLRGGRRHGLADTPSSCGSSGRGTADDGAGSDRSSVSYSDVGYNSISTTAAAANGYEISR